MIPPTAQELRELAAQERHDFKVLWTVFERDPENADEDAKYARRCELTAIALDRWADEIDMERNINRVLE
jgi:hypothetical protein